MWNVAAIGHDIEFPSCHFKICVFHEQLPGTSASAKVCMNKFSSNVQYRPIFAFQKKKSINFYILVWYWNGILSFLDCVKFYELQLMTMLFAFGHLLLIEKEWEKRERKSVLNRRNLHEFTCIFWNIYQNGWRPFSDSRKSVSSIKWRWNPFTRPF